MARTLTLVLLLSLTASVAYAQTPYIGASASADVVRFSGSSGEELSVFEGDGEALGWALRAGTPLGDRWGIDAEFVRGGRVKSEVSFPFVSPSDLISPPSTLISPPSTIGSGFGTGSFIFMSTGEDFELTRRDRFSTLSTTAWFRHELTGRFALDYHGGLAFLRAEQELTMVMPSFAFACVSGAFFCNDIIDVPATVQTNRRVFYSAAPIVGLDARIDVTERLSVVPGIRLLMVEADGERGLMTRPSVGLQWAF